MKQIKVKIAPDGTPTVEGVGFGNVGCKKALKPIEDALGEVSAPVNKPEAYVQETNGNHNTLKNGW